MDNNKMRLDPILAISLLLMIKQLFVCAFVIVKNEMLS